MEEIPKFVTDLINQKQESDFSPLTCIVCDFYQPTQEGTGQCHRYPPTAAGFVDVIDDDWCGEHSEREEN